MRRTAALAVTAVLVSACGSSSASRSTKNAPAPELVARIDAIQAAITVWKAAPDLAAVKAAAETARNLVVGPDGPDYGDGSGDGTVQGASAVGLLPGKSGQAGLVATTDPSRCVAADVLGGSWSDPAARWAQAEAAVAAWTTTNNPFPSLNSHPQRIYGWASLTLQTSSLDAAHGFASDAQLHIDRTRQAVEHC